MRQAVQVANVTHHRLLEEKAVEEVPFEPQLCGAHNILWPLRVLVVREVVPRDVAAGRHGVLTGRVLFVDDQSVRTIS